MKRKFDITRPSVLRQRTRASGSDYTYGRDGHRFEPGYAAARAAQVAEVNQRAFDNGMRIVRKWSI